MQVTLARLTLLAPHCHSRKDRRAVVRRIRDRVMAKHKVLVAEVGGQETWQRIEIGFAVVGADGPLCDQVADQVLRLIDELDLARRVDLQRERISFGEHREDAGDWDGWVPDFEAGGKS